MACKHVPVFITPYRRPFRGSEFRNYMLFGRTYGAWFRPDNEARRSDYFRDGLEREKEANDGDDACVIHVV